jgi:putative (di)nucleoside polyphosphate hydrolase
MTERERLPYRPCVGVMLLNTHGHVFVGRRADHADAPEGAGTWWQMPQGGLDEGEDPEAGARRELQEETGVRSARFIARTRHWHTYDLPSELLGVAWEGRYRGQKQMWFAARFEGEDSEIDIGPRAGHEQEFDAWRWVKMAELLELVVPFKREVYASVIGEFGPLVD